MERKTYMVTKECGKAIDATIDTALRSNGLSSLQRVNNLITDYQAGVVSIDPETQVTITTLNPTSIDTLIYMGDLHLKANGMSVFNTVQTVLMMTNNPIIQEPIPDTPAEHISQEPEVKEVSDK